MTAKWRAVRIFCKNFGSKEWCRDKVAKIQLNDVGLAGALAVRMRHQRCRARARALRDLRRKVQEDAVVQDREEDEEQGKEQGGRTHARCSPAMQGEHVQSAAAAKQQGEHLRRQWRCPWGTCKNPTKV